MSLWGFFCEVSIGVNDKSKLTRGGEDYEKILCIGYSNTIVSTTDSPDIESHGGCAVHSREGSGDR